MQPEARSRRSQKPEAKRQKKKKHKCQTKYPSMQNWSPSNSITARELGIKPIHEDIY